MGARRAWEGSSGHRTGCSSAAAHPVKPGAPGGLRRTVLLCPPGVGCAALCWLPRRPIPSAGWGRGGLGGVSSPHSPPLSPSFFIFLLPCPLLIFSFSSDSRSYSPLFSPSPHAAHPSSSSLLCFSRPLVPSVALLSPRTCLLSI